MGGSSCLAEGSGLTLTATSGSWGWRSFQQVKGKGLLRGRWMGGWKELRFQVLALATLKLVKTWGWVSGTGWTTRHRGAADLKEEQ